VRGVVRRQELGEYQISQFDTDTDADADADADSLAKDTRADKLFDLIVAPLHIR
jgi:hypothetical protein